ncbi:MAG: globin [Gammaproteobacteria bacterium]|nr:MAG: globin [Gammaproteobacteria bacterium]
MSNSSTAPIYGIKDASFLAAGQEQGVRALANAFYDEMESLPEAQIILAMHPKDLEVSRDKLACFLCGWLGGPKRYKEKYGSIRIPLAHRHLAIGTSERDAWLLCMERALQKQDYQESFRRYLIEQLYVPAEASRNQA